MSAYTTFRLRHAKAYHNGLSNSMSVHMPGWYWKRSSAVSPADWHGPHPSPAQADNQAREFMTDLGDKQRSAAR